MSNKISILLVILLFAAVVVGVVSNIKEQNAVDDSKIPQKVEEDRGFQRWITNLRNKDIVIEADGFRLVEKNEIYNTKWMKVYSIEESGKQEEYDKIIAEHKDVKDVVFSPSERIFLDYRNISRNGYNSNEVHFYGLRDDKIIDARILDCSIRANCIFDRAYFLDNEVFVITEISRSIDKKDLTIQTCLPSESCSYSFKLHLVDLINNSRLIYESKPFDAVLDELAPEL